MLKKQLRIDKKLFNELFKGKPDFKLFGQQSFIFCFNDEKTKFGVFLKNKDIKTASRRNYVRRISYDLYSKHLPVFGIIIIMGFNSQNIQNLSYATLEKDFLYYKKCLEKYLSK